MVDIAESLLEVLQDVELTKYTERELENGIKICNHITWAEVATLSILVYDYCELKFLFRLFILTWFQILVLTFNEEVCFLLQ